MIKWNDGWKNGIIPSDEAVEKWPHLVLDFFKSKVSFVKAVAVDAKRQGVRFEPTENENAFFF